MYNIFLHTLPSCRCISQRIKAVFQSFLFVCLWWLLCVFVFQLRPPTVIGQFHTLFFGSVRMFFLGVLAFAVYGNEALHFSCNPDRRVLNLYCYNQFRPITPQVRLLLPSTAKQHYTSLAHMEWVHQSCSVVNGYGKVISSHGHILACTHAVVCNKGLLQREPITQP